MISVQEACNGLFDQEQSISAALTEEDAKAFFVTLNKIAFWAHQRAEEVLDSVIAEIEKP